VAVASQSSLPGGLTAGGQPDGTCLASCSTIWRLYETTFHHNRRALLALHVPFRGSRFSRGSRFGSVLSRYRMDASKLVRYEITDLF
jgi:hypothetical protein